MEISTVGDLSLSCVWCNAYNVVHTTILPRLRSPVKGLDDIYSMKFKVARRHKADSVKAYPALVVWNDAHEVFSEWSTLEDLEDKQTLCYSLGWVIPDAKEGHVVVAGSIIAGKRGNAEYLGSGVAIPEEMVISITKIKI